ncbi:hypothetical protein CBR_g57861 [Chara braunii]|uniref:Fatty acid hydroxylase domain-containing protein n=1 Tax=Chara braunii TaxID=69332 RepID=A0A388K890_CHABU|nr:hypothetical protein CBR_g57861 [Chara braunii]|eukprot:GBG66260.1 hypothetical protein CBR_g57861 [Chara braunii]
MMLLSSEVAKAMGGMREGGGGGLGVVGNLTWAEAQWVQITSGWSDFQLYCCTFWILLAGYILGALPYMILDYLRIPFFEMYRLQPGFYNDGRTIFKCCRDVMLVFFTTVLPLQLLSYPYFKVSGITGALPLPSLTTVVLQLAVFFIIEDFGNYWIHRWFHNGWAYKYFHYKHHEFTTPMSFAASYAHPVEVLVLGIPTLAGPAIVKCHVLTLWLWINLRNWEALETHSGYDFPWALTKLIPFYGGAEYHDYHHLIGGKSQGNFASVFTYCDWLYGTDKGYRFRKEFELKKMREMAMAQEQGKMEASDGHNLANGSLPVEEKKKQV